jgi:hypothetical protein
VHDREYFDRLRFCAVDDAVWEARESALLDIAFDLGVHIRPTSDSVEGIFQDVEKTPVKTWLSSPLKARRLIRLNSSFPMPQDSHQACFFRSSAMTVSESINSTSPRSICSQRR